ncbi:MAG TPA: glycosyltransferase [bacterium]|nr:glycosyltransferase [bacterium]
MNILQMVPELECGGVETGTVDIALKLKESGNNSFVVTSGGSLVAKLRDAGVGCYLLPVHKKSLLSMVRCIMKVRRIILLERIEVVHARSRVPAWIGWFAVKGTPAHFVTTAHGHYKTHSASAVMGFGERVIVPSYAILDHMEKGFGVEKERLRLIPRGVDVKRFRQKEPELSGLKDSFNIAVIGRLTPIKGHVYVIRAMEQVLRECPHAKLFIVGDAHPSKFRYKEELLKLVETLGLNDKVVFTGACHDVPKILESVDLVVLATTVPEAFGRVIIEAQASCIPVIGTRLGGVLDIIDDGVTGLLVEPKDVQGLTAAIIRMIKEGALRELLVDNAYKKVSTEYTLQKMFSATLQVYEEVVLTKKILIVKLSALGDIVLISPSIRALKNKYRYASLSVLTSSRYKSLFANCPDIDTIFTYDKEKNVGAIVSAVRGIRRGRYDIAIDFQNTIRSHLILFLSGIRKTVGYNRHGGHFLLSDSITADSKPIDPVSHQFKLLSLLGITLEDRRIEFWSNDDDARMIDNFLKRHGVTNGETLVAVSPGGSPRWETKRWPKERFVELIRELGEKYRAKIVLVGGEDNADLKEYFGQHAGVPYVDAIGETSVTQLGALIRRCSLLITGDTAPLHIAAGCAVPFVALFGPTDPQRHLPSGTGVAITKNVSCSPCGKSVCEVFLCMDKITVSDVLGHADAFLKKTE